MINLTSSEIMYLSPPFLKNRNVDNTLSWVKDYDQKTLFLLYVFIPLPGKKYWLFSYLKTLINSGFAGYHNYNQYHRTLTEMYFAKYFNPLFSPNKK